MAKLGLPGRKRQGEEVRGTDISKKILSLIGYLVSNHKSFRSFQKEGSAWGKEDSQVGLVKLKPH